MSWTCIKLGNWGLGWEWQKTVHCSLRDLSWYLNLNPAGCQNYTLLYVHLIVLAMIAPESCHSRTTRDQTGEHTWGPTTNRGRTKKSGCGNTQDCIKGPSTGEWVGCLFWAIWTVLIPGSMWKWSGSASCKYLSLYVQKPVFVSHCLSSYCN
jgi:hypothetical protein